MFGETGAVGVNVDDAASEGLHCQLGGIHHRVTVRVRAQRRGVTGEGDGGDTTEALPQLIRAAQMPRSRSWLRHLIRVSRPERTAALLLVAAGDNAGRIISEAAFAHLCGVAPIHASSGKVTRHRLNRGGNRQANHALWRIVFTRMSSDRRTRAYVDRRSLEGRSRPEMQQALDSRIGWQRGVRASDRGRDGIVVKISATSPTPDEPMWRDLEPQGSPPSSPRGPPAVYPRQESLRSAVRFTQTVTFSSLLLPPARGSSRITSPVVRKSRNVT